MNSVNTSQDRRAVERLRMRCHGIRAIGMCFLASAAHAKGKKLIDYGHGVPTPAYAKEHFREIDKLPFEGTCFILGRGAPQPHEGTPWDNLSWGGWSSKRFKWEDVKHHADDLAACRFEKLRHNFVVFVMSPADLDWFDDHEAIVGNAGLAARIAKQAGHCDGILLDPEMYFGGKLWDYDGNYGRAKYADVYSFKEYVARARLRGRQVMQAMQAEFPGLNVLVLHSYSLAWLCWHRDPSRVQEPQNSYTLLPAFLDGLYDAAANGTKVIDGQEVAYHYTTRAQFEAGYRDTKQELLPMVGDPAAYKRSISAGFGLFMNKPKPGEEKTPDISKWFFTPAQFEGNLTAALQICDEYVWLYSEGPLGWSGHRTEFGPPPEFREAVLRARKAAGLD